MIDNDCVRFQMAAQDGLVLKVMCSQRIRIQREGGPDPKYLYLVPEAKFEGVAVCLHVVCF